jgi:hypothetical protein
MTFSGLTFIATPFYQHRVVDRVQTVLPHGNYATMAGEGLRSTYTALVSHPERS